MAESQEKYADTSFTTNLGLTLPGVDDMADIGVINDNFEIIDSKLSFVINSSSAQGALHINQPRNDDGEFDSSKEFNEAYGEINLINPDINKYQSVLITVWSLYECVCTPITLYCTNLENSDEITMAYLGYPCADNPITTTDKNMKKSGVEYTIKEPSRKYSGMLQRRRYVKTINEKETQKGLTIKLTNPTPYYQAEKDNKKYLNIPTIYIKAIWFAS